jgi:hypothetical protein
MSSGAFLSLPALDCRQMADLSKWFGEQFGGSVGVIITTREISSALAEAVGSAEPGSPFSRLFSGIPVLTAEDDVAAYVLAVSRAKQNDNVLLVSA